MDVKIKSAVVTGPTGVIGSALVRYLAEKGIDTYAVCHPGSARNRDIPDNRFIHKIYCNLSEICSLPELIGENIDTFFHLAWMGTQDRRNRMDMYMQNINVRYALDSVKVAAELKCKVYVGAGSQAEYGHIDGVIHSDNSENPITGYGMAKLCAGQMTRAMCHEYGIRHVWPRILSVYGPNDGKETLINTVIYNLLEHKVPALTSGEQVWDYLYSMDAAEALLAMAECGRDGAKYTLGSGHTKQLKEFMLLVRDAVNPDAEIGIGQIEYLPNQVMHLEADISDLTKDTDWKPHTAFEDGIRMTVDQIRKNGGDCPKTRT